MGRWSASHWKTATFGWLALVVVAFGIGGMVGTKNPNPNTAGPGESGRMDRILHDGFKRPAAENVLIQSRDRHGRHGRVRRGREGRRRPRLARGRRPERPLAARPPATRTRSRRTGTRRSSAFDIRGEIDKAPDKVGPVIDAVAAAQAAHPGFFIGEMGDASAPKAVMDQYGKDLGKAGMLSLPITLIILLVTFGALVAAGIPLLLALTAVFGTFGLVALREPRASDGERGAGARAPGRARGRRRLLDVLPPARARGTRKGPERTRRARGGRRHLGRSVLISGLTVMVAMAGMFVTGDKTLASFGVATMMVVAVAMLGSLTVLPALLSRLGDGVDGVASGAAAPTAARAGCGAGSSTASSGVRRCPRRSPAGCCSCSPSPRSRCGWRTPRRTRSRRSLEVVKTYKRMQQAFPGTALPANVIVKAPNVNAPAVREAISELEQRALASGRAHEPITIAVNHGPHGREHHDPDRRATAATRRRTRSLTLLRKTIIPRDRRRASEHGSRRHRADRAMEGLEPTRSALRFRSSSRSCSCSRSR